jgi:hypothetical protein
MNRAVAIANNDTVFLSWVYHEKIAECLGFAVYRNVVGQRTALPAWVGFKGGSNPNWVHNDTTALSKLTQQSRTLDRTLADRLGKKFVIVNRIEELLPIDVEGGKTKNLALSLQNSTILQITDDELLQVQRQVVQGDCREAIEQNISNGATVCQTREAIKGDLVMR